MARADSPALSPDGQTLAYLHHWIDAATDRRRSALRRLDLRSGQEGALGDTSAGCSSPAWSPDGQTLYCIESTVTASAIVAHGSDGSRTVAQAPGEMLTALAVSRRGDRLAFAASVPRVPPPLVELPASPHSQAWAPPPRVVQHVLSDSDAAGPLDLRHSHLYVLDITTGALHQVTDDSNPCAYYSGFGEAPCWVDDDQALVANARVSAFPDGMESDARLFRVELATGATRTVSPQGLLAFSAAASPDGRMVAFVGASTGAHYCPDYRLWCMDSQGRGARCLSEALDRPAWSPAWDADGQSIVFRYDDHAITRIGRVDLAGRVAELAAHASRAWNGPISTAAGGRVAVRNTAPDRDGEVLLIEPGTATRTVTNAAGPLHARRRFATMESLVYPASIDGRNIEAMLYKPPGFDASKRYPLVVEIHGGPQQHVSPRYIDVLQAIACAGYLVVCPNYRGSTSYGHEFLHLCEEGYPGTHGQPDHAGTPLRDIEDAIAAVVAHGWADDGNVFLTGGSAGGELSTWLLGRRHFKAAVVRYPYVNIASQTLTSDICDAYIDSFGRPWEQPDGGWSRSALAGIAGCTTPTLVMVGTADRVTPPGESLQLFNALRTLGVEVALALFDGENHGMGRRPSNRMWYAAYILEWFAQHGGLPVRLEASAETAGD